MRGLRLGMAETAGLSFLTASIWLTAAAAEFLAARRGERRSILLGETRRLLKLALTYVIAYVIPL